MRHLFIDTSYLIAAFNPDDRLHRPAMRLSDELSTDSSVRFVSTTLILSEFLASTSKRGARSRRRSAEYVEALVREPRVTVVDVTRDLFQQAVVLYKSRPDKRYSLADCASMIVCHQSDVAEVLTSDSDFEHEGLLRLLDPNV